MHSPEFCTYNTETQIHYIDYSGRIDLAEGKKRIEQLEEYFTSFVQSGKTIRVLMDARKYEKFSPEIHDQLAKLARQNFNKEFKIKLAVVDANYHQQLSATEAWFTNIDMAINWLNE